MDFLFSRILKKERKANTKQTSFLMLNEKKVNSSTTIDSSSIKLCKKGKTLGASVNLKPWILQNWEHHLVTNDHETSSGHTQSLNKKKPINNDLADVPCKRWWYLTSHPHSNLSIVTLNYNSSKQQCLLKHNDFISKLAK